MPAIHLVCSVKNASYETLPRKKLNNASVHLFRLLIQRARGLPAVAPPVRKLQIVIVVEALLPVGIFVIDSEELCERLCSSKDDVASFDSSDDESCFLSIHPMDSHRPRYFL